MKTTDHRFLVFMIILSLGLLWNPVKIFGDRSENETETIRNYSDTLIRDTLDKALLPYDDNTVNQILGTAAVESDFFTFISQHGGGPGLGYFQCQPATRRDIIDNYLKYRPRLRKRLESIFGNLNISDKYFMLNLPLQIIFCYLHYDRYAAWGKNVYCYATEWKRVYNTPQGKGTIEKFIVKYHQYVEE